MSQVSSTASNPHTLPDPLSSPGSDRHTNKRIGILSQTIAPSPIIKWILAARIRTRFKRDIVFVGESFIQLREFFPTNYLADATAKLNLGTQILAATVISAKVEQVSLLDALRDREYDDERFFIKGEACKDDQPPQLVVLCTATNELVFFYAKDIGSRNAKFVFAKRHLLDGGSLPSRFTKHIAIDERSKALAIAGSDDSFAMYALKDVDDLKSSIDGWNCRDPSSFKPFTEQRRFQVDGYIQKMDFLKSSSDEPHKTHLLLLVAKAGQTRMFLYRWDVRDSLRDVKVMDSSGQLLQETDSVPLLIIPSVKPNSLAIVTETDIVFYDDVCSSAVTRRSAIPLPESPSHSCPQTWVQWAKPLRHEQHTRKNEDIFVVREDGLLTCYVRPHDLSSRNSRQIPVGELKMRVDSALCMLPAHRPLGGDILIAGGDMTDGGLFHLPPREELKLLQKIPNVSPVRDMVVLNKSASGSYSFANSRTFVTAGGEPDSAMVELRSGLEAQVRLILPCASFDRHRTTDRVWVLRDKAANKVYVVTSCFDHTAVIQVDLTDVDPTPPEYLDHTTCPGLELESPTLAVAETRSGSVLQITRTTIQLSNVSLRSAEPFEKKPVDACVCAHIDEASDLFVFAHASGPGCALRIGLVDESDTLPRTIMASGSQKLDKRPLSLGLVQLGHQHVVAAGYFDGSIEIFMFDSESGFIFSNRLPGSGDHGSGIADLVLLSHKQAARLLLLSGSQSGTFTIHEIARNAQVPGRLNVKHLTTQQLGNTVVKIVAEKGAEYAKPTDALIHCESRLKRLQYFGTAATADYQISDVWITQHHDLSTQQPSILALQRIPDIDDHAAPSGFLVCVTEEDILFTSLLMQEQVVPRYSAISGMATCLKYSMYLKHFLVATIIPVKGAASQNQHGSMLALLDPDKCYNEEHAPVAIPIGRPGEVVKTLTDFGPSDQGVQYEMIIIGLQGKDKSRICYYMVKGLSKASTTTGGGTLRTAKEFPGKTLYDISPFRETSLAVSVDTDLVIIQLDFATKKWMQRTRFSLPSVGLSLSIKGNSIYTATAYHSLLVLQWQEKKLRRVSSDQRARDARHALPFGPRMDHILLSTVSDEGSSLLGFEMNCDRVNSARPVFEAHIPLMLNQLVHVDALPGARSHQTFQGSTLDGTVYLFKTLSHDEVKLLRFVEQLSQPDIAKAAKRPMSLLTKKMATTFMAAFDRDVVKSFDPRSMHINGDILQRVIDDGPERLRQLLQPAVKSEDEDMFDLEVSMVNQLRTLADPVLGHPDDIAATVTVWIRQLLNTHIS